MLPKAPSPEDEEFWERYAMSRQGCFLFSDHQSLVLNFCFFKLAGHGFSVSGLSVLKSFLPF